MYLLKKVFKVIFIVALIIFIGLLIAAHQFLKPISDVKIIEKLTESYTQPKVWYNNLSGFEYRVVATQKEIDITLPILVFVHGSPGSAMDFKRYLKDSLLNTKANLLAYDRVGYGPKNHGKTQANLQFEVAVLHDLIKEYPTDKIVLVGYSYGGPVVLASNKNYKYKVSLAGAVVGAYEPMFKALAFYNFAPTRWFMPLKVRAAAKEKYAHVDEFPKYKDKWNESPSKIINIHGDKDWIVPYKNSEFLTTVIDDDKFKMITIHEGGHDLIWSNFDLIKQQLLKTLD